jgi:hypothetical protein
VPFTVVPITHSDVAKCIDIRVNCLGSLVVGCLPPYPSYQRDQEAVVHHELKHSSGHIHHLKVIDTDNNNTVAYAKWEIYKLGRPEIAEDTNSDREEPNNLDDY